MPEWLLKNDSYTPIDDKDAFINKSILSLLNVLSKFRRQTEYKSKRFSINSLVKFISTIIVIVFLSLSKSSSLVFITFVLLLVILNFLSTEMMKSILKVSAVVTVFTFIILLPSVFMGNGNNILIITSKVFISVTAVNILASTTNWSKLTETFKVIHVPDMFIFVLDTTIKYIIVLGEFSLNMLYALKLRSVGKSNNKNGSLSGIMGTMFIKSKEMAEDMHDAMQCRGFTGEYKVYNKEKFKIADYGCIVIDIMFIGMFFYFNNI